MTAASEAWVLVLGTLPVSDGLRMLEAAEVRYFPGADSTRFEALCTIRDLDAFLASDGAQTPRVGLADSRREGNVPDNEFANDEGQVDPPRLFALYDGGATLVLTQMHQVLAPLGRFCRGMEQVFLHPVQCNIYLTPPGAQGFRTHYDTHDVLILQIQGEKLWRFWPTPLVPFANLRTPMQKPPTPQDEPRTQMLRAGDVLYVPRGVMHDAASQGAHGSLHLTIGILGQSWGDALRSALDVMEREDPTLRQLFPMWRLAEGGISDDLVQEAGRRLSALGTSDVMELMSQQLLTRLATERMPMVSRGLIAPSVAPTDLLCLCDTVHHFVIPRQDGTAELRWAGGHVTLSAQQFGWLARIGEGGVTAADLGGPEALTFCQRLASDGLLTIQPAIVMKAAE